MDLLYSRTPTRIDASGGNVISRTETAQHHLIRYFMNAQYLCLTWVLIGTNLPPFCSVFS